ncbi:MAG: OB-fold nucleic acid binding domain-containing protein [Pseudomonadota bacterium]
MTGPAWPRPPACLTADQLDRPPERARVTVAGLVIVRQRPGSAKGVIFVTLEDETGVVNVVVWGGTYERFRRAVIAGRLLRVTGRIQREGQVVHVVAEFIEDISHMLDDLARGELTMPIPLAPADEVRKPVPPTARHPRQQAKALFRGR